MSKCNYIISCSFNESFGRIPLEASLLKIPVIASNSGAHKETIVDHYTGILVEPDNELSYLEAVKKLESNKDLRKQIINNAYHRTKEKFSKENHYNNMIEYYEKNCFYN